ncbi:MULTISPECIES: hypothetical protein [Pseudomonas]|uniref:hypothetical protein n=1 Tax=Pseudomonas TaxID=286 RepID=UPI0011798C5C|nr:MULTISPECIES: hypothetical protein [Pseudomonas]
MTFNGFFQAVWRLSGTFLMQVISACGLGKTPVSRGHALAIEALDELRQAAPFHPLSRYLCPYVFP